MALYDQLPVYKASYDLLISLYGISKKMDRDYKFTLGEKIKNEASSLIVNIYRANSIHNKISYLMAAKENIEVIRLLMRVYRDLKQVSIAEYVVLSEKIESVSRQINSWYKQQITITKNSSA